jgi:syringomycin synthetase protein SyrE
MLAYEIASQMTARGEAVEFVGLLDTEAGNDTPAPARPATAQGLLMLSCEGQADERMNAERGLDAATIRFRRNAHGSLSAAADAMAYDQLFARCAEAQLLPHYISRMDATQARQYLARLAAHENAIETYRPAALDLAVRIFVAADEPDAENEHLGWDKVLAPQNLRLVRVKGNHRTMVEVHAQDLGQSITRELTAAGMNTPAVPM